MKGGKAKREMYHEAFKRIAIVSHFWSASWSSIYAYYMSFRSSGSQQSNALNGVRFGVEMKKLEPLEDDHTKLKANFAGCEMVSFKLQNFAAILHACENLLSAS